MVYETNLADQVAANIKAANRVVSKMTDVAADQLAEADPGQPVRLSGPAQPSG